MTRTVVVGAGGAGAPLAARLAADPRRDVLVLEAGAAGPTRPDLLDGGTLVGAVPGYPGTWSFPTELFPGHDYTVGRGRLVGGSTTTNGGYFRRATRADWDGWAARIGVGGGSWRYDEVVPVMESVERVVPHVRAAQDNPVSQAFSAAASDLGWAAEPVVTNIVDGVRWNTGLTFLGPARDYGDLEIRGDAQVVRVLFTADDRRVRGVEMSTGATVAADEVVLCAGAVMTPHILLHSGIGPCVELQRWGIPVVADLPVGQGFADHPNVAVDWRPRGAARIEDPDQHLVFPTVMDADLPTGPVEILAAVKSAGTMLTGVPDARMQLTVGLQAPRSRGTLRLRSASPGDPPEMRYRYLSDAADRAGLRAGVRLAAELLAHSAFSDISDGPTDPDRRVLGDDDALEAWIRERLGTTVHLCATAPAGSVCEANGQVRGVPGLWVADTSLLPDVPQRGPAHTAVVLGDLVGRWMTES